MNLLNRPGPKTPAVILRSLLCWSLLGSAYADLTINLYPSADTSLFENAPSNNLGGMAFAPVGTSLINTRARALLKFDVAGSIPATATINSARLDLVAVLVVGANTYGLNRVLNDWGEGDNVGGPSGGTVGSLADEGEATWYARFFSTNTSALWSAPGAQAGSDYISAPSAVAAIEISGSTNSFASAALAADVQLWLINPGTNFGWMLIATNETLPGAAARVATREDATNRPVLMIGYSLPAVPPTITNVTLAGGLFHFSFNAQSNRTYAVEFRVSLQSGTWATLTNVPAQPADTTIPFSDTFSNSNGFYRVRTP